MKTIALYISNVVLFSVPWAIFEVWLEKYKSGWGGEFWHPFWGKKLYPKLILTVFQKSYITPYHIIFYLIWAVLIFGEYFFFYQPKSIMAWIEGWFMAIKVIGVEIIPLIFLPAVLLGVTVLEDFLWVIFNTMFKWHFPDAIDRFFRGDFPWHTHWVNITANIKLPSFYLYLPVEITVILIFQSLLLKHFAR